MQRTRTSRRRKQAQMKFARQVIRMAVVLFCLGGFIYQAMEFLILYWTYPTVVDIQEISPSLLEVPTFTICNPVGFNYTEICRRKGTCMNFAKYRLVVVHLCEAFSSICKNGTLLASDYQVMIFKKFLLGVEYLEREEHDILRQHLEEYMECHIHYNGRTEPCNMSYVMGSFYTKDDLPQFCYSIYSLWGEPEKRCEKISKGAVMKFHFSLNTTRRPGIEAQLEDWAPKFTMPTGTYVQISVHSPHFLSSPYQEGSRFDGGKSYQMRITRNDKHLLPLPYQTNCTDYLKTWKENKGKGPINQLGVVQKCRVEKYYQAINCVPLNVDYPHTYRICGQLALNRLNQSINEDECTMLADHYNQACDSMTYISTVIEKDITNETGIVKHDCEGYKIWYPECNAIDVEVLFDRFKITETTYNAKYESLELFSVIGGYMGMWLGISLVTVYDFAGTVLGYARTWVLKVRREWKKDLLQKDKDLAVYITSRGGRKSTRRRKLTTACSS